MNKQALLDIFKVKRVKKLENIPMLDDNVLYIVPFSGAIGEALGSQTKINELMADQAFRATIFISCVSDADGNLLFNESDLPEIKQMPFPTLVHVTDEIIEYSGINIPRAEAIEDAKKK